MEEIDKGITEEWWSAILARDAGWDGRFVFGVRTTGIYCKPSCPAKRPNRKSVIFFKNGNEARSNGFRPCKRCHPDMPDNRHDKFDGIIRVLESHMDETLTIARWADLAGVTPQELRRSVGEFMGVTPRDVLNHKKILNFSGAVRSGEDIVTAQNTAGFGSSSRLYEKFYSFLGMTPGEFKKRGKNVIIFYAIRDTRLGKMLIAETEEGVCFLQFADSDSLLMDELSREFSEAEFQPDPDRMSPWTEKVLGYLEGKIRTLDVPLDVKTTAFRLKVWEAIRRIPFGETRSYAQLAEMIGNPSAARAVASACAANPVALVTPCHRVVHGDGSISGYRWGVERKKVLLDLEKNARG